MKTSDIPCYAFVARHASRHLSQFYEHRVAPSGIHVQQLTILIMVRQHAPVTLTALAQELAMDRTTLARNLQPLERDGVISIGLCEQDRRHRAIELTPQGAAQLQQALTLWREAQQEFEQRFGVKRAARLREELREAALAVSD